MKRPMHYTRITHLSFFLFPGVLFRNANRINIIENKILLKILDVEIYYIEPNSIIIIQLELWDDKHLSSRLDIARPLWLGLPYDLINLTVIMMTVPDFQQNYVPAGLLRFPKINTNFTWFQLIIQFSNEELKKII